MMNRMKSHILIGLFLLLTGPLLAQPAITLEAFGGWLWTSKAGNNGSIRVDDKGNYGARLGVSPRSDLVVEFEWNQTETNFYWFTLVGGDQSASGTMNYYMLGINRQLGEGPAVPYGLFNLGVMNLKGTTVSFSENWFTAGFGGGLKYYMNDRLGIRLQARLLLPMQFAGIGLGCGTGGCGGGVSAYTTTIQGDFTGGVILKMGG